MFEFLFKYPGSTFAKGTFVFLSAWPRSVLLVGMLTLAAVTAGAVWRRRYSLLPRLKYRRIVILWILQSAPLLVLLLLLWQPAISVTSLEPQQNIVAVVVDNSRSMQLRDTGKARGQRATEVLDSHLLKNLRARFQVRLYRMGSDLERISTLGELHFSSQSTQIGKALRQIADESATLPIGSVVLLSDGADTTNGIDEDTLGQLRHKRLPVNTIGFGRDQIANDVELERLDIPSSALAGSRVEAQITLKQNGFQGKHARLELLSGKAVLASHDVAFKGPEQVETLEFNAGNSGSKNVEARIAIQPEETNRENNQLTRVLSVDETKRRILYVEGEPRWEYKFIRRAAEDDSVLQVVSMLRTTQNKIYRQGISSPNELLEGFPSKAAELFGYQALVIGSVESAFFSQSQQQLIKDFVDRRGGGLLFLAGRSSLSDGGYSAIPFSELLPVNLPTRKNTFQRAFVAAELTDAGKQSPICKIEDDAAKNADHWEVLPYLANYQDPGTPKPGAIVLANVNASGRRVPLLVTENYGRGRTAVFATAGSWRWRMQQPVSDTSQETFWRQLLRWTSASTPSQVIASTPTPDLSDDGHLQLRAEVRDKNYLPVSDAQVSSTILKPDGSSEDIELAADPSTSGNYSAEWNAADQGSYVARIKARRASETFGADTFAFRRQNGAAENFHQEQNRDLLQKLADETGGRYYTPDKTSRLSEEIAYSDAGITSREMKDLWNMPVVFLLLLSFWSTEWWLRRKWGVI